MLHFHLHVFQASVSAGGGGIFRHIRESSRAGVGRRDGQALQYFIVPQSTWPVGRLYAVADRDQLDSIADRIMSQLKADFMAPRPPRKYRHYWIRKLHEVSKRQARSQYLHLYRKD